MKKDKSKVVFKVENNNSTLAIITLLEHRIEENFEMLRKVYLRKIVMSKCYTLYDFCFKEKDLNKYINSLRREQAHACIQLHILTCVQGLVP